jgi:Flp pilus assembly pilin Flp
MTPDHERQITRRCGTTSPLVALLLRDESGVTTLEYIVAGVALALAAVAASRAIAGVLVGYLHRIYLVVTLPIP